MKKITLTLAVLMLIASACCKKTTDENSLPRSTPAREGVSSELIMKYLDAVEGNTPEQQLHSIMVIKNGQVVAEGWWGPNSSTELHAMHSVSKSFTATAVGFAVSEGLLTVEDRVISFFPKEVLPETISPNLEKLKVKHLLTMSTGQLSEPPARREPGNWAKTFFATPIDNEPGTVFLYSSMATYMLSAIVQKVSGEKVMDYLKPRLWEPLGISGIKWAEDPSGINTGGWGLELKTEDMAKFGQLFLAEGMWNGKRVLPEGWTKEASTMRIMQTYGGEGTPDNPDWFQGYCYQMWRSRHNAYRADGANGQYIIMIPEHNAVVVATAKVANMQAELDQIWDYILPALKGPATKKTDARLAEKLKTLVVK